MNAPQQHRVRATDSFNGIAAEWGVSQEELARVNPQVTNLDEITEGQTLNLPPNATQPGNRVAMSGETLADPNIPKPGPTDQSIQPQGINNDQEFGNAPLPAAEAEPAMPAPEAVEAFRKNLVYLYDLSITLTGLPLDMLIHEVMRSAAQEGAQTTGRIMDYGTGPRILADRETMERFTKSYFARASGQPMPEA